MGVKQVTQITDDFDGSDLTGKDIEPQTITFEGKKYEVYMSAANTERFQDFLSGTAPLVQKSSSSTGSGRRSSSTAPTNSTVNTYGYPVADVRSWAVSEGLKGKNGNPITEETRRINQDIYDAYHEAQNK